MKLHQAVVWGVIFAMTLTAAPPAPLNIVIVEGEGAVNNLKQRTGREVIVEVQDENHKPIAGAAVVFLLPGNGPSASFANGAKVLNGVTDKAGRVTARIVQPQGTGTVHINVTASYQGSTGTATINQTNAVGAASAVGTKIAIIAAIAAVGGIVGGLIANRDSGPAPVQSLSLTVGQPIAGPPRH